MYSGAQNKQDFMRRVGSHATKGHASRGVIDCAAVQHESLPQTFEVTLAELKDERARLCAMPVQQGKEDERRRARLTELNLQIKRLNVEAANREQSRTLFLAIHDVLDEATAQRVLDRAREIRFGGEA